nr:SPFH domain-containing protein [Candidatus Sigynarchaeota archaeon]
MPSEEDEDVNFSSPRKRGSKSINGRAGNPGTGTTFSEKKLDSDVVAGSGVSRTTPKRTTTMSSSAKRAIKSLVLVLVLICGGTALIVTLAGYENLDVNEYGLKQNWITKEIVGDPVKGGGFHYVGIEYDYVRFPATWQDVQFIPHDGDDIPINTQTKDGLAITFDASFQYKLKMESLKQVYSDFALGYNEQIVEVSRGALRNVASEYSATQFLQNRSSVADAMRVEIVNVLTSMDIEIEYFQLRAITLPEAFMEATEQVEVARLQQQIETYKLQAAIIAGQQTVLQAEIAANVTLIEAYAAANVTITEAQAQATALNITRSMESFTIAEFMTSTGMNETQAIAFFYVQALQNLPEGTVLVLSDFVSLLLGV